MLNGQHVDIKRTGDFDPVPMDRYTCQISDVNLVTQQKFNSLENEEVLNYQFVILDDKPMPKKEGQEAGTTRGRLLWRRCRPALNSKSWLGKLAKAVYGRDLTREEQDGFDPESLIGKQVDVMVEQAESKTGDQIFNNIVTFSKVSKPLEGFEDLPKNSGVIEKQSVSVKASEATESPDAFIKGLEEEAAKAGK